eukprot:3763-Chlamydomonas_euryale.AAC.4
MGVGMATWAWDGPEMGHTLGCGVVNVAQANGHVYVRRRGKCMRRCAWRMGRCTWRMAHRVHDSVPTSRPNILSQCPVRISCPNIPSEHPIPMSSPSVPSRHPYHHAVCRTAPNATPVHTPISTPCYPQSRCR